MADAITIKALQDASLDAKSLEEVVNGDEAKQVTTRLGETYPSVKKAVKTMFENGGLPATPFATKVLMTASSLADGDYAQVTDDGANNGLYRKETGAWVKSSYDPLAQANSYADNNALFNPTVIEVETDLNSIKTSGYYITSTADFATTANNYPSKSATGLLSVFTSARTSLIIQRYFTLDGVSSFRKYVGASWTTWTKDLSADVLMPFLSDYQLKADALSVVGVLSATDNLNDFTKSGFWVKGSGGSSMPDYNYPESRSGYLTVINTPASSVVFQSYTSSNNGTTYNRARVGGTWGSWFLTGNKERFTVKDKLSTQNLDGLKELGVYIKNTITSTAVADLNHPTEYAGVLKVFKGDATSFIVQEFVSVDDGFIYTRSFNNIKWSNWKTKSAGDSTPTTAVSGIAYTKTANSLIFYTKGVNNNSIKYELRHNINPSKQMDIWGIRSCEEVDASLTLVKPITSDGVWECAIKATDSVGDHSGGTHGDEVLQKAYFFVDGVYREQDFVGDGRAKEIKVYQESTLYIEGQSTVFCYKTVTHTITEDGINIKQKIVFPTAKSIETGWIAMLPVLRKVNPDNTGAQVTDTEFRTNDGVIVDVSEPSFPLRIQPVVDGDSVNLSSAVSGISAEITINKISATDNAQIYVANPALYNKVYVSAHKVSQTYVTSADETWFTDTTFKINTRN